MFTVGISRASHLLLICTGVPVFHDFLALADLASAVCDREGWRRVLIDCVSVPPTFTMAERAELAAYAGAAMPLQHVAIVVADEKRFEGAESATGSALSQLRYFTNIVDAAHWLAMAPA